MSRSLNSIMNEMARTQSAMAKVKPRQAHHGMKALTELEAFRLLDNTLENLHKQYIDAKAQTKELVSLNGTDDAMASVAIDMEDSAWCAMQTRYLELREKRHLMAQAQDMMRRRERQLNDLKERVEQSHKQRQARDFMNYLKLMEMIKKKNKTPQIFEWLMLFLIFRDKFFGQHAQQNSYNKLATAL